MNSATAQDAVESSADPDSVTSGNPEIPVEELRLLLKPLTKVQLIIEADAWQSIVQKKAEEIVRAEIAVKRQNREIIKAEAIQDKAQSAKESLKVVKEKAAEAGETGDEKAAAIAEEAARKAKAEMREVKETAAEAAEAADRTDEMHEQMSEETKEASGKTAKAAERAIDAVDEVKESAGEAIADIGDKPADAVELGKAAERTVQVAEEAAAATDEVSRKSSGAPGKLDAEAGPTATEQAKVMDRTVKAMAEAQTAKKNEKVNLLEKVTELREEQTTLLDRFRAAIDALENKTAQGDSETLAKIKDFRLYARSVSGIEVDVSDTTSAWIAIKGWVLSKEGGVRWVVNLAKFIGILIGAWIIARLLSAAIHRGLKRVRGTSRLLENFLVKAVRWVVLAIGLIMALAALEISVGPLLAVVGAAGFVIAFALQDTLSNFASGIMILFFKPFDEGDVIEAGGIAGKVESMNLVSTTVNTFDNKRMVVPNNKIWNDVITNATGVTQRRVDMEFGIGYSEDIDDARKILEEIIASHPKVLQEPGPTIRLHTLADSSVNFIVRPWVRASDYWDVYWDVTESVKKRFDAAGIGIPFPQRDVHLFLEDGGSHSEVANLASHLSSNQRKE